MSWKELGACVTENPFDKRFITEPHDRVLQMELTAVCASCDVFDECKADADEFQVSGVFQAGAWRD